MKILLTNDDGYLAPGLTELKKILSKYGEVFVVAPHSWKSGMSCAISFFNRLVIHNIDDHTWSVEGTPADCVIVASQVLNLDDIDLVVSGCNNGYNLSYDSLYSGTCGACYQALMFGKKAIAFSCAKFREDSWQIGEDMEKAFKYILDNNMLSEKYFLNVNMQEPEFPKAKGIKLCKLYPRPSIFKSELYHAAKMQYDYHHEYVTDNENTKYDIGATKQGYISIVPQKLPEGDLEAIDSLSRYSIKY